MSAAANIVKSLLENDEADDFIDREIINRKLPRKIEIWGKRWHSRASGYHRAHVFVDDQKVHVSGLAYGSSDQYVQTGLQWLVDNFYLPPPPCGHVNTVYVRDLGIECVLHGNDVKRERDTL